MGLIRTRWMPLPGEAVRVLVLRGSPPRWSRSDSRSAGAGRFRRVPNIYRPVFEEADRPDGFRSRRARIGYELGSELIGCSLWEIPPGEVAYPYHYHFADEEVVIVVQGRPTLRTNPARTSCILHSSRHQPCNTRPAAGHG